MKIEHIDNNENFDFGRTSADYAKYRDIYPPEFFSPIIDEGLCLKGQKILDLGTGTGVLPRALYKYGGNWVGVDISQSQIDEAIRLAGRDAMNIDFQCVSAEDMSFSDRTFDTVVACQCFTYFEHDRLAPILNRILKDRGKFAVMYLAWLPFEDEIAQKSEQLVLKYNPKWTGCNERRRYIDIPKTYGKFFNLDKQEIFDLDIEFDTESWNGRMKSCRGIGATLSQNEIEKWEKEHLDLLRCITEKIQNKALRRLQHTFQTLKKQASKKLT